MRQLTFTAGEEDQRLDKAISRQLEELSRTAAQSLCQGGGVLVNGRRGKSSCSAPGTW